MKVVIATVDDIEALKEVAFEWRDSCKAKDFGIELVPETYFSHLNDLVNDVDSDLLLLMEKDKIVGYMGLILFQSPLGNQDIANEHFFYIKPKYRGMPVVRLINSALDWAKERGCSHLILNASRLASSQYPRVCMLYERLKFREWEKSYILAL